MINLIYEFFGVGKTFIVIYTILFTLPYLFSSFMFYVFGFFAEKKIRVHTEIIPRVSIPAGLGFIFRFRGVDAERKLFSSVIGVGCQAISLVYFIVMESFSFIYIALKKDCIIPCRISWVMFLIMLVIFVGLLIYTSRLFKKGAMLQQEFEQAHMFDENETVDINLADEYVSTPAPKNEKEEKMHEMMQDMIDEYTSEAESDFDTEIVDMNRGKEILNEASKRLTDLNIYE